MDDQEISQLVEEKVDSSEFDFDDEEDDEEDETGNPENEEASRVFRNSSLGL